MFEGEKLIAFVDGFVTDKSDLTDEMYERAEMHDENGAWQMILVSIRSGIPETWLCGTVAPVRHRGCQKTGEEGTCVDV